MSELIMSVKSRLSMFGLYNLYDLVEKQKLKIKVLEEQLDWQKSETARLNAELREQIEEIKRKVQ